MNLAHQVQFVAVGEPPAGQSRRRFQRRRRLGRCPADVNPNFGFGVDLIDVLPTGTPARGKIESSAPMRQRSPPAPAHARPPAALAGMAAIGTAHRPISRGSSVLAGGFGDCASNRVCRVTVARNITSIQDHQVQPQSSGSAGSVELSRIVRLKRN